MADTLIIAAVRPLAPGQKFTQTEVDHLNAVDASFQARATQLAQPPAAPAVPAAPTSLKDSDAFFTGLRSSGLFESFAQPQVDGLNACLAACGVAGWPLAWTAYALATAFHETNHTMQPVREAYWLSENWRQTHLRYFPFYGRGYVQCTWQQNYQRADTELGLNGALMANLDLMMKPEVAAPTMVRGMADGWFVPGHNLARFLPSNGLGSFDQFKASRTIINGHDKDEAIAGYAVKFQSALQTGGWS